MKKLTPTKTFLFLLIPYLLFIGLKTSSEYKQIRIIETKINYESSTYLKEFLRSFREVYLNRFLSEHTEPTKQTVKFLPALTTREISEKFAEYTQKKALITTVSDRPRNPKSGLDPDEKIAFNFFKVNPQQTEFFRDITIDGAEYTLYSAPIYVKKGCLTCHGKNTVAPVFIKEHYTDAYDYKAGDLRGIISIKISRNHIHSELIDQLFIKTTSTTLIISTLSFFIILLLLRTIKKNDADHINQLSHEVSRQTHFLQSSINTLEAYKVALDNNSIVSRSDTRGFITYMNDKLCELSGYSYDELIGQPHSIFRDPEVSPQLFKELWQTIQNKQTWTGIFSSRRKNGSTFWTISTIAPILTVTGEIGEYIGIRQDITELIEKREQLQELLTTDSLTKLPNRFSLLRALESSPSASILLLDIHNFGDINDCYGVTVGDQVIIKLANRIQQSAESYNLTLYRLHGDQFVLLCTKHYSNDIFQGICQTIIKDATYKPIQVAENTIFINLMSGLSIQSSDPLVFADIALKKAKKGSIDFVVFEGEKNAKKDLQHNQHWIAKLIKALHEDRVLPFYQAIVDSRTKEIKKYECLVRMIDEDGRIISPFEFLDIAKKARLYPQITRTVINQAFKTFANEAYDFSINLSSEDITNPSFNNFFIEKLENCSFSNRLIIEILETEGFEQYEQVAEFIQKVKRYGVKIAIDDFGTGHSNYERLMKLDVDYLKIDGSIIRQITTNDVAATIAETITTVASKIGIKTVAEFVFDEATAEKATLIGCDHLQGYYFSEPQKNLIIPQNDSNQS